MMTININKSLFFIAFFALFLFVLSDSAIAGSAQGLPWEGPIDKIKDSLTGPVALGIAILGMFVAGGMLIFGGELGEFTRRMIMIVLVVALLVAGNNIFSNLGFQTAGAVIGAAES